MGVRMIRLCVIAGLVSLWGCESGQDSGPGSPSSADTIIPFSPGSSSPGKDPVPDMGGFGDMGQGAGGVACGAPQPGDTSSAFVPCLPECGDFEDPSLLIVLDRSGSMAFEDKWERALEAIYKVGDALGDKAMLGLTIFPDRGGQCAGELLLAPTLRAGLDLEVLTQNIIPNGNTPLSAALVDVIQSRWYLPYGDIGQTNRPKAIVLVTDGAPTECKPGQDVQAESLEHIRELARQGVRTYVVGFGFADDERFLKDAAYFGGTKTHFVTRDTSGLVSALEDISKDLERCTIP